MPGLRHRKCNLLTIMQAVSKTICRATKCPFRVRATSHIFGIHLNEDTSVAGHFNLPDHLIHRDLEILLIEQTTILEYNGEGK